MRPSTVFASIVICNYLVYLFLLVFQFGKDDINMNGVYFTSMPLHLRGEDFLVVTQAFLLLMVCPVLSHLLLRKRSGSAVNGIKVFDLISQVLIYKKILYLLLFFLCVLSVIHFSLINYNLFWFNYDYQIIKTPHEIGSESVFFRIYHFLFRIIGLIAAIFLVFSIRLRVLGLQFFSAFLFFYSFFILYVGESRWVVVYLFALLFSRLSFYDNKPNTSEILIWFCVFVFLFAKVIIGRNFGLWGLSVQYEIAKEVFDIGFYHLLLGVVVNFFEGFTNFANTVSSEYLYPVRYKILSFSPLPSFIDGYSSIINYQYRVNIYVPFNSISEAFAFGGLYIFLLLIILTVFLYSCDIVFLHANAVARTILVCITIWNVMYFFGYPLRNVIRVFEYVIICNFVFYYMLLSRESFE